MNWYYLAGPMTGYDNFNYDAFDIAAKKIRAAGYNVRSSHEIDHGETPETRGTKPWKAYMVKAIVLLTTCNNIILLPGWSESRGAKRELELALAMDMRVWYYTYTDPIMEIK